MGSTPTYVCNRFAETPHHQVKPGCKVIANNDLDISPQNAPLNGLILDQLALCLIMSNAPMERSAVVANVTQG